MPLRTSVAILLTAATFNLTAFAQQSAPACGTPPSILQSTQPNIFSEQQEQWLGEAMADHVDRDYSPIRNPALSAYVKTIGDRLLATLPPTRIQFHYTLVESSEVNGFSLAGGRVYLTRKLVASARTEDEIAGVIAHEMGHILSHQFAVETTADMHRLLGIDSVTDRADIYAKYQRLVDARMHQKHQSNPDSDDKQDQADRVAVYASAAAGYRPQAYAEFWDRSFFVGGKTGGRVSDFLGITTTNEKRLRRIRGIIADLPPGCGAATQVAATPAFQQWQHQVLEDQAAGSIGPPPVPPAPVSPDASISGAASNGSKNPTATPIASEIALTPPLHMDIDRLRFSRDGKYVLAQDQSSVFVLTREPFQELFRFDAENALPADFTPDSKQVAFATRGLHVELWDIAAKKLVSAHEIVNQHDCFQTRLSPDGRTITCLTLLDHEGVGIDLIDVETQKVVFEKKSWFQPSYGLLLHLFYQRQNEDYYDLITSGVSADGNTLLIGPGLDRLAFDLRTRAQIRIEGAAKSSDYPVFYCFQGNDKIVAISGSYVDSGVFTFPGGQRISKSKAHLEGITAATGSDLVITPAPVEYHAAIALADMAADKYVFASNAAAVDVFGTQFVNEDPDGSILLGKLQSKDVEDRHVATLSLSPLADSSFFNLSPDGRFLVAASRSRSSFWDIATGKQVLLTRGLRNPWWTSKNEVLGVVPELDKEHPRSMGLITMSPRSSRKLTYKLPEHAFLQSGHLVEWKQEKGDAYSLTVSSPADMSTQWTRFFAEQPGMTTNDADTDFIFSYPIQSPNARDRLKANPALKAAADAIKQKTAGRLIEIVNSADGTVRSSVVVQVPLTYEGVAGFNRVGNLLYLTIGDNRTIVYDLKTGTELRQLFGSIVAADTASRHVCIYNRRNEAIVYDATGAELSHLNLAVSLRYATLRDNGATLLVVTADQHLHRFPVTPPALAAAVHP